MYNKEDSKKCFCLTCNNIFGIDEAIKVKRNIYGIDVEERRCPECGGDYRMVYISRSLDKYLDINKDPRYYYYR